MRPRAVLGGIVGLFLLASAAPTSHAEVDNGDPQLSLRRTNPQVTATKYGSRAVTVDVPVYVQAEHAPLDLRIRRQTYKDPLALFQVKHTSSGEQWVELESDHLDGWKGLLDFSRIRIRDAAGNIVYSETERFCPNNWERQRVDDSGPTSPVFPDQCFGRDRSFLKGMAWGIERSWAVPLTNSVRLRVDPGQFQASVRIRRPYRELFGIGRADALARFAVTVEKGDPEDGEFDHGLGRAAAGASSDEPLPQGTTPALPDLEALPAFHIDVENSGNGKSSIEFAATIWNSGVSPLVVEGFRRADEDVMDAYQYFYDGNEPVGREPAGTLEYDRRDGHFHWHFLQFARYRMRSLDTGAVVRSNKQSFCVVPTDAVDLSLGPASWGTDARDLRTSCGGAGALWIREVLPVGWGDTYSQVAGQAFGITNLPNGHYWVEVEANPKGLLHEDDVTNNLVRRRVILMGRKGNRTIHVRNWQGIDY